MGMSFLMMNPLSASHPRHLRATKFGRWRVNFAGLAV
jgi:hypothetical protein